MPDILFVSLGFLVPKGHIDLNFCRHMVAVPLVLGRGSHVSLSLGSTSAFCATVGRPSVRNP